MSQLPERTEEVTILMTLDALAYQRHKEAVRTLVPKYRDEDVQQDDQINVTYRFRASYYGLVKNLQAVEELCDDPDVITTVDCAELEEKRILVHEVLKKLDNIIQRVKKRKHPGCFLSRIFKYWFFGRASLETRDLERRATAMAGQDMLHTKFLKLPWVKALFVKRYEDNLARVPMDGRTLIVTQDQYDEAKEALAQPHDDVKLIGYTLIPGDN